MPALVNLETHIATQARTTKTTETGKKSEQINSENCLHSSHSLIKKALIIKWRR